MTPQISPHFPLEIVALIVLVLLLFGIGFNAFVNWVNQRRLWPVSLSVVIGVVVTLLVPTATFGYWEVGGVYLVCFVASGVPMIWGNVHRHVKKSHKARRIGNHAAKVRDDVVMDLNLMADDIVNGGAQVADIVHRLHQAVGSLKSL